MPHRSPEQLARKKHIPDHIRTESLLRGEGGGLEFKLSRGHDMYKLESNLHNLRIIPYKYHKVSSYIPM